MLYTVAIHRTTILMTAYMHMATMNGESHSGFDPLSRRSRNTLLKTGLIMPMSDEIVVVSCPALLRRERAIARGMTGEDFDARAAGQPSDEWLADHATTIIDNSGTSEELLSQVRRWYATREANGWR